MNKKRAPRRHGSANWKTTRPTSNNSLQTQKTAPQWTQTDWNKAAILGIAVILFNFAFREIQTRVILAVAGTFWVLFCLFCVIRLLTGLTLGIALSVFAFLGATTVINSPQSDTFSIIIFFIIFAFGLYCAVSFSKKLFWGSLKEAYKRITQSRTLNAPENGEQSKVANAPILSPTANASPVAMEKSPKAKQFSVHEIIANLDEIRPNLEVANQASGAKTYLCTYDDELFPAAVDIVLETGQASTSMLQRRLKLGYFRASRLIDEMESKGYVEPFEGSRPRQILITCEQWKQMRDHIHYSPSKSEKTVISTEQIVRDEENWRREKLGLSPVEYELQRVDGMEGHAFEEWCADLLRGNGFRSVEVTPGSGDQGVDVTAEKDGLKYAVQCKRYSSDLGNTPIQEVVAGKAFYRCHVGAVMTNRYFTSGAKELAKVNGILLWDRDVIVSMLKTENPPEKQDDLIKAI